MNGVEKLTPQEYFDSIKAAKQHITDEDLTRVYDNCLTLLHKYVITGQTKAAKKIAFHLESITREREIVKAGIDTFVYRSDIEEYIDNVSEKCVVVTELERYEREIPDEIVDLIEKHKDKFTDLYVVFTDYTGEVRKQVSEERRAKDPILFGVIRDKNTNTMIERFYYLGDWEDEYCDLTLDKMVNEMKSKADTDIERHVSTPIDIEELKRQLNQLEGHGTDFVLNNNHVVKNGLFHKIKTVFSRRK